MDDASKRRRRVARLTSFAVGGGVALALAFAAPSGAQEVVSQDATVTNTGTGEANSGGNTAEGNTSENVAVTNQSANGTLGAVNNGGGGNTSSGSASVSTGSATAVGNSSNTGVSQSATTGGTGPSVVSQDTAVTNTGTAAANSGDNTATGNDSTNTAVTDQDATGVVAANNAGGGNTSSGNASVTTGAATAVGTQADVGVAQAAHTSGGGILGITVQDVDVVNVGSAVANTGGNDANGNESVNTALAFQDANGLIAANNAGGGNTSSGNASIVSGAATAVGVDAIVGVDQSATHGDLGGIVIVVQQPFILNVGNAVANSGGNTTTGNSSFNLALAVQSAGGLVAYNVNPGGNHASGNAAVITGNATAAGTRVITAVRQRLA